MISRRSVYNAAAGAVGAGALAGAMLFCSAPAAQAAPGPTVGTSFAMNGPHGPGGPGGPHGPGGGPGPGGHGVGHGGWDRGGHGGWDRGGHGGWDRGGHGGWDRGGHGGWGHGGGGHSWW